MSLFLKSLIVFSLILMSNLSAQETSQIKDFGQLLSSLKKGAQVRVVFHYAKCRLVVDSTEEKSPDVTGGMGIDEFEYFPAGSIKNPKGYLVFSKSVLISHRKYGYVINYVKCRVFEDNTVEVNARYITPDKYETVMNETFYCTISNGENDEGVLFFHRRLILDFRVKIW
ncbi:MAG: hypothetical protein IPJ75_13950 [Ignavibacteriales bacterium]|nr:hypothetical protein [Ignavibacteriales bacterium]